MKLRLDCSPFANTARGKKWRKTQEELAGSSMKFQYVPIISQHLHLSFPKMVVFKTRKAMWWVQGYVDSEKNDTLKSPIFTWYIKKKHKNIQTLFTNSNMVSILLPVIFSPCDFPRATNRFLPQRCHTFRTLPTVGRFLLSGHGFPRHILGTSHWERCGGRTMMKSMGY